MKDLVKILKKQNFVKEKELDPDIYLQQQAKNHKKIVSAMGIYLNSCPILLSSDIEDAVHKLEETYGQILLPKYGIKAYILPPEHHSNGNPFFF